MAEQERYELAVDLYKIETKRKAIKKRLNELEIILLTEQKTRAEVRRETAQKPPAPENEPAPPPPAPNTETKPA